MAGTLVANTINTDTGLFSTNNAYNGIAKAWVNFAGSTGTINSSFNVSSITRNNTGYYTVNFTTAMPNANYSVSASSSTNGSTVGIPFLYCDTVSSNALVSPTTSAFNFCVSNAAQNTRIDGTYVQVAVFGS